MDNFFDKTLKLLLKIKRDILMEREIIFDKAEEEIQFANKRCTDENPNIL
ncbi:MAG: hypothetical protein Q4E07_03760 [Eubacteriales bacterium]|nr:hypothetical protein [Eubacteriales bacterium]